MWNNLRADTKRYLKIISGKNKIERILRLAFTQEYYSVVIFRYGKWARGVKIPILGLILRLLYFFMNKFISILSGVEIWLDSEIEEGLLIAHYGGVYILANIGQNCTIAQQVVIGYKGAGQGPGTPTLGNNVYLGAGAKIIGKVVIGNSVRVGANAVVTKDVPDNATVVGVPARIVRINHV